MTRKPTFWIVLALLGLSGSILAFRLFPVAFPILSVEIDMDREGALDRARELALRFQWSPEEFRQAASFGQLNPAFQTYMELEGGGLEEINRLAREGVFSLYAWRVRHFSEGAVEEAEIRFTPPGESYGFRLRLSEETPGDNLSAEEARALAMDEASTEWGIDPGLYGLIESSQEEQPGGRIDHTFVYERSDVVLGEARVRLRLRVGGNQLVELTPFVHVPDGFQRRYQDTRSANESISLLGTIVFLLIFLILGGGLGTVHLLRNRWIEWKAPLAWGGLVAGLMALGQVNSLPLSWMSYNTALPYQLHIATLVLTAGLIFVAGTVTLALLFMAGEGLMRLGFPDHIQQWKIWAPGVANSTPAMGRTIAPYLILGVELAFVVVFYLATSRFLGWWSPASALAEPDLLATYFPWLTAVSNSLFAALSEETLFRAIPIGAAAIVGRRYGKPGLWIWGAVVLQALVFGASHANYPQQPAYARVVEIFPTYLGWGAVCVYFGLIPSIIAHFIYDLVLFSLPLFAAETDGIWIDRMFVAAAGFLPLGIVLVSRLRKGGMATAPDWVLNRNWKAARRPAPGGSTPAPAADPLPGPESDVEPTESQITPPDRTKPTRPGLSLFGRATLFGVGFVGLILWISGLETQGTPHITRTRSGVEAEARSVLQEQGITLGADWIPLFSINGQQNLAHQFVWREGSESDYESLLGTYLTTPGWQVQFVNFEVAPEERAESYTVSFPESGEAPRVRHVLPEGRPGESLSESDARALALAATGTLLRESPNPVREISAEEVARPDRTDWVFTFEATGEIPFTDGEARLEVRIAGDEIVDARRYVHVPESWEREWRARESTRGLLSLLTTSVLMLLATGGMIVAIVRWTRGALLMPPLRVLTLLLGTLLLVTSVNEWPNAMAGLTTQMAFSNQVAMILLGLGLGLVFMAVGVGLMAALGQSWIQAGRSTLYGPDRVGLALGSAFVGISAFLSRATAGGPPNWPDFSGAVSFVPWVSAALGGPVGFLMMTAVALLLMGTLARIRGTRWRWAGVPLVLLVGLTLAPNPAGESWVTWAASAVGLSGGIGILWASCRRLGWSLLPGVLAAPVILGLITSGVQHPYPGHSLGAVLGIVLVLAGTRLWAKAL